MHGVREELRFQVSRGNSSVQDFAFGNFNKGDLEWKKSVTMKPKAELLQVE